jgi:tetratricopeptide (TPR) repeat protein
MLHADVAVLRHRIDGYDLPAYGRPMTMIMDGRTVTTSRGTYHWPFSRRLIDLASPEPQKDAYVRLWYQATSASLQGWNLFAELEEHLRHALDVLPNDARLLLYVGTMHQAYAEPRRQNAIRPPPTPTDIGTAAVRSTAPSPLGPQPFGTPATEWRLAERFLRQALAADDTLVEARIRLGYVLGRRLQHREALAEIDRALARPLDRLMQYYALAIRGRELYALKRLDEATVALDQAAGLYSRAQSPRLLMSQIARDRGDRAGAVRALTVLAAAADDWDREDPWWIFERVHVPTSDQLLQELRARRP